MIKKNVCNTHTPPSLWKMGKWEKDQMKMDINPPIPKRGEYKRAGLFPTMGKQREKIGKKTTR